MSTILGAGLYGLEVWGPDVVPSMHCFDNELQGLASNFFKHGMRLPRRTARTIVTLESGCPFVHGHCLRRISKAIIRWEKHGPAEVQAALASDTALHEWRNFVTSTLGLYWPLNSHPYPSTVVRAAERLLYTPYLHDRYSASRRDVRAEKCEGRVIATYVQHIWNGKFDCPHPVHTTPSIPCRDYRWWLRVRTLTFPAPAYTHHFSSSRSHHCNLGCIDARGDLLHLLTECPYAQIAQPTINVPSHNVAFFSPSVDPHDAARQATMLCDRLRAANNMGIHATHMGSDSAEP